MFKTRSAGSRARHEYSNGAVLLVKDDMDS